MPQHLSDDLGLVLSNPDPDDVRMRWSRHLVFNLSRPEKSLVLLAPLSKQAGGYGLCRLKGSPHPDPLPKGEGTIRNPLTKGEGTIRNPFPKGEGTRSDQGGVGRPAPNGGVFRDRTDPDYQKILALCVAGKDHLDRIKRFDMPGFRPPAMYVREMKRFGILPETVDATDPVNVYATDQAYWRSLWWLPQVGQRHVRASSGPPPPCGLLIYATMISVTQ